MSLGLLPVRFGLRRQTVHTTRHRAVDEVERQKGMRAGADLLIQALRLQLDDQDREHEQTVARIDARHAEVVDGMQRQIDELQRRLDIACKAETAVTQTQELSVAEILRHCTPVPLHEARDAGLLGPVTDPGHATTS
ncbi:hypothetical protein ACKI1J_15145 [Streptomyces scabiei]|uniref:hypothetical protein n=1 Tax=Streptomyces scabiei TaxID=1930 RepID=UPI0038F61C71